MHLIPQPHKITLSTARCQAGFSTEIIEQKDATLPDEGYSLVIKAKQIEIRASSKAGFYYGRKTLSQIKRQHSEALPCLEITDVPDFAHRGFMLDVSRCQVPTLEKLYELIDLLADLKLNQLQLYTEHTFAYANHEEVWQDASPLTAQEIQALDQYCNERFIELVPNQNSLGHMERWLKHDAYKHLAECPEGFIHPLTQEHKPASSLKPNEASATFMQSLYQTLLPNFTSASFNIGLDEPWELGTGWSKEQSEKRGKHQVYCDYLNLLNKHVNALGKKTLFWADIILEKPELIEQVPESCTPIVWGYEADHPFDAQCRVMHQAKRAFYVAPGTSTWNSFSGRLDNALSNLKNAGEIGLRNGATGYLITAWGDNGHHQPWSTLYPALLQGAATAWNVSNSKDLNLESALNIFLQDTESKIGNALIQLGRIESQLPSIANHSFHFKAFFQERESLKQYLDSIRIESLNTIDEQTFTIEQAVKSAAPQHPMATDAQSDLILATKMIRLAIKKVTLPPKNKGSLKAELDEIIDLFEKRWLMRNRPGGLEESIQLLQSVKID